MVSLMSKGFFLFLFILPDVILCDETESPIFMEDAEGNRFFFGVLLGDERLPEKEQMKEGQPLPESFDAREKWPECKHIIGLIRNQKQCGSCWAFSVAEVISDRICIQSNGYKQVVVSPEDLVTCCRCHEWKHCKGCRGCDPVIAYRYWIENGIVTGGDFNSHEGCRPYTIPDGWDYHNTPTCSKRCEEGYPFAYEDDKHYGSRVYSIFADVTQIQHEIYNNGPVSAVFHVYPDFFSYNKSGIYYHTDDGTSSKYSHAIKIIGWGVEDKTPYWMCANSWGARWGVNGYFRILRGHPKYNCGIETLISAGMP